MASAWWLHPFFISVYAWWLHAVILCSGLVKKIEEVKAKQPPHVFLFSLIKFSQMLQHVQCTIEKSKSHRGDITCAMYRLALYNFSISCLSGLAVASCWLNGKTFPSKPSAWKSMSESGCYQVTESWRGPDQYRNVMRPTSVCVSIVVSRTACAGTTGSQWP